MKRAFLLLILGIYFLIGINNCSFAQDENRKELEPFLQTEVTIKKGTEFMTLLENEISSEKTQPGDELTFKMFANFVVDGKIVFFQKSLFKGVVVDFSKKSLLGSSYNLVVDIDSLDVPFRGIYKVSAHPEFAMKKDKKHKGRRFRIGVNKRPSADLIDHMDEKTEFKEEDDLFVIEAGTQVPVVFDEDLTVELKK